MAEKNNNDEKYSEKDTLLGLFNNTFIIYKMKKFL